MKIPLILIVRLFSGVVIDPGKNIDDMEGSRSLCRRYVDFPFHEIHISREEN